MKSLVVKAIAGLGVTGVIGTSVAGVWYVNQPKDVKSKLVSEGLTLVGSSPRAWRAVFLTHKEDSEFMSFIGTSEIGSDKLLGPKVMASCETAMKVDVGSENYSSSLSKAKRYCTVPKFKTIESKVLFSDKEIAFEERDWKNLFTIHKTDNSFIEKVKLANSPNPTLNADTGVDTAKNLVQKFCNDLKGKSPESESVSDYEKYCLQSLPNARSFYENRGSKFVEGNGWGEKFDAIKSNDTSLFEAIKDTETLTSTSLSDKGGPQLQAWCNKEVVKEMYSVDPNIKNRCFN